MMKPWGDDFTDRSKLFDKQGHIVYRVIRIRGGKDENLDVRDGNRSSKKTRINFDKLYWHTCSLSPSSCQSLSLFLCIELVRNSRVVQMLLISVSVGIYFIKVFIGRVEVENDPRVIQEILYRGL